MIASGSEHHEINDTVRKRTLPQLLSGHGRPDAHGHRDGPTIAITMTMNITITITITSTISYYTYIYIYIYIYIHTHT